ncbi:MAG TPA: DMT family transporter [Dermatophilaceae bacterium]|nr:DMT family transporter [Dermatophilaceae bacterium]
MTAHPTTTHDVAPGTTDPIKATRVLWQVKFTALAFIWGSSFLLMKVGLRSLAPLQISGLRILSGATVLLLLLTAARGRLPRDRRIWGHLMVTGFFLGSLPFSLFALGEERVSSALAGIGNSITPIATVLFSLLLLKHDKIEARKIVGVLIGFVGVLVILQPWESQGRPDLLGFGMTLVAGTSYGVGWTYTKRFLIKADFGGLTLPAAQMLTSAGQMLVALPIWWLTQRTRLSLAAPWSLHANTDGGSVLWPVLAVLALGVIGTGIAMSFQYDVVRAAGPTVGASVTYLIPVVSVALGVLVLHERLQWPQFVGAAVVLTAAVLIGRSRRR